MKATSTSITQVATIGIPVSDQNRALEFYVQTLGFEKRRDVPFGGTRWIEVAPQGAETTIALVPAGARIPAGIRLATEDANSDHANLRASGVDADPEVMRMGELVPPMFSFRDPDGNSIVIVGVA
jgi:catechol 2,3-dioxygenase-like lactoylglutathione lyase family enzyme